MKYLGKVKAPKPPPKKPDPVDPSNRIAELHEDDKASYREGHVYGLKHAAEFAESDHVDLPALIGTYSDAEAHALLDAYRERFWAQVWKPAGK